jgi:hypothetical protein
MTDFAPGFAAASRSPETDSAKPPDPLTPPECDLRGLDWMPLYGSRILTSDFFLIASAAEFRAAFALWVRSWEQIPAGSLPNDDRILASLSCAGAAWPKVKERALHGWMFCNNGRLYHPFIASLAVGAWERRKADRERKAASRARRGQDADATRTSRGQDADVRIDKKRQDTDRIFKNPDAMHQESSAVPSDPPGFAAWWQAYPKKDAKGAARKAYSSVLKRGATPQGLLQAVAVYPFDLRDGGKFVPLPTSWLNQDRWESAAEAAEFKKFAAESTGGSAYARAARDVIATLDNRTIDGTLTEEGPFA